MNERLRKISDALDVAIAKLNDLRCSRCDGEGEVDGYICSRCDGDGVDPDKRRTSS